MRTENTQYDSYIHKEIVGGNKRKSDLHNATAPIFPQALCLLLYKYIHNETVYRAQVVGKKYSCQITHGTHEAKHVTGSIHNLTAMTV